MGMHRTENMDTQFPDLNTERLILRRITEADVEAIHSIYSDPEIMKHYDMGPITSIDEAMRIIDSNERVYESGDGIRWGIVKRENAELIGTCGYHGRNRSFHSA